MEKSLKLSIIRISNLEEKSFWRDKKIIIKMKRENNKIFCYRKRAEIIEISKILKLIALFEKDLNVF